MLFQLNIQLDHIVDLMLDKIGENDIRLIAGRQGIPGSGKKILRLIQIQLRPDAQAQGSQLLRMILWVVLDL